MRFVIKSVSSLQKAICRRINYLIIIIIIIIITIINKYDICQLEVHDVEVYLLHYQLFPGRLVRSKKSPVALSDVVSTNVGFFASRFERFHSPRREVSGFPCFFHRKYICLLKSYLFYKDNHLLQFFCEQA